MSAYIPTAPTRPINQDKRGRNRAGLCPSHSSSFLARTLRASPLRQHVGKTSALRMAKVDTPVEDVERPQTKKELAAIYGGSYLLTSVALSIVSYIVLYFMIAAGVNVRALVTAFGDWLATTPLGKPAALDSISDTASTAALAYIAHKVTSPLRFPLTIAATPIVAKAFSSGSSDTKNADSS